MKIYRKFLCLITSFILIYSCEQENYILDSYDEDVTTPEATGIIGFYLLNEGNMGSNLATIDYMNFSTGVYKRNIYAAANPTIVKELGDVGNDLKVYGNKLYAVINRSNLIEVMDARTAKHIGTIPLDNGRHINFANGKAYATSFAGSPSANPNSPYGRVVEIDTINLSITREVTVGFQPEELEIINDELFVANSGGYNHPNYDNTISIINLNSFELIDKIIVDVNLNKLKKDAYGDLYVTSRGIYGKTSANLHVIDSGTREIKKSFNIPISNLAIDDDELYYYTYDFGSKSSHYGLINTKTEEIISTNLINDPILKNRTPYGIAINPETKDIFITDAVNYVSKGFVLCFNKNGLFKWKIDAGNIPAHIAFINKK